MDVVLKRDAFLGSGKDAHLYRKSPAGGSTSVPDEFRGKLPKDARILGKASIEQPVEQPVIEEPNPARELDVERAVSDSAEEVQAKAEEERLARVQAAKAARKGK